MVPQLSHNDEALIYFPDIQERRSYAKLKNWRPITLHNTDHKILTKALANRLQQILPQLIHPDQTACIPGRTRNDNIRLIQDAINYANEIQTPLPVRSTSIVCHMIICLPLYGGPQLSHQKPNAHSKLQIAHSKFKSSTANSNRSQQVKVTRSKFKLLTANYK